MVYNLLRESWISARAADGSVRPVTPLDIPRLGDELVDIEWGRPEFRVATYELLVGVFSVALAGLLADSGGRAALFDTPPDDLAARLARLEPFFDVDGVGPRFLQDLESIDSDVRPLDALLIDGPSHGDSESQAAFFQKRGRFKCLSRRAAAIALYAMQSFAPSGGRGHRTSMRGGGPLSTLVVPENPTLWRRIVANLPLLVGADKEFRPGTDLGIVFPWARPTRVSTNDRKTERGPDAHFLQCFFGMPRRIRLVLAPNPGRAPCAITGDVDETIVTGFVTAPWGVSYGVWRHPLSPYYLGKPGDPPLPIHAQGGRVGYRDWAAYLFRTGAADMRAEQVGDFERSFPLQADARLMAAGFVTDNMKCLDWAEGEAPLFILPDDAARTELAELAHGRLAPAAGTVASALRGALRQSLGVDDAQKTPIAAALDRFWIETEAPFFAALDAAQALLRDVDADALGEVDFSDIAERWLEALRRVALRIFHTTAPVERLGDLDAKTVENVVAAAKSLRLCLTGYGKLGADLFTTLALTPPARATPKSGRAGRTAQGATP